MTVLVERIIINIKQVIIGPRYTLPVIWKNILLKYGRINIIGTIPNNRFTLNQSVELELQ